MFKIIMRDSFLYCALSDTFFTIISNKYIWAIVASVIGAIIVLAGDRFLKRIALKMKYGKAAGKYICYGYKKDKNQKETEYLEKNGNSATIIYKGKNVLKINLFETNPKHEWKGEILMELETKGSVAWRYTKLHGKKVGFNNEHKFGLKHCIVREDKEENKMYVYLIGEKLEGFDKEILVRDLKNK